MEMEIMDTVCGVWVVPYLIACAAPVCLACNVASRMWGVLSICSGLWEYGYDYGGCDWEFCVQDSDLIHLRGRKERSCTHDICIRYVCIYVPEFRLPKHQRDEPYEPSQVLFPDLVQ